MQPLLPLGAGLDQTLSRSLLRVEDGSELIRKWALADIVALVTHTAPTLEGVFKIVGYDNCVHIPRRICLQVFVQLLLVDVQNLVLLNFLSMFEVPVSCFIKRLLRNILNGLQDRLLLCIFTSQEVHEVDRPS